MIRKCLTTSDLINSGRFSVLILVVTLIGNLQLGWSQPCDTVESKLDWKAVEWVDGQKNGTLRIDTDNGDSVLLFVSISTFARGTFNAFGISTPYIDGRRQWHLGKSYDLGVMFDPMPGQDRSEVFIDIRFSRPVSCLSFEVSDIDASGSRRDSIMITGNSGRKLPTLTRLSSLSTVGVRGHTASALGYPSGPTRSGSSLQDQDAGTVSVEFGSDIIETVSIVYFEASDEKDPGGRGIGVLGNLVFDQVKLDPLTIVEYTIDKDDECLPLLKLETQYEYNLDEYIVEYSYDGLNYAEAYRFNAHNSYVQNNRYAEAIPRKLNNENYFRISGKSKYGEIFPLDMVSVTGSDCYNFTYVNIYPNPSYKDFFFVEIETSRPQETDIVVYDQSGKQMLKTRHELKKGNNWLKISSKSFTPGVYHVRFAAGDEIVSRKVSII